MHACLLALPVEVHKHTGDLKLMKLMMPAAAMAWSEGDRWTLHMDLAPCTSHAFKCVVARVDGSFAWEEGGNRRLYVRTIALPSCLRSHMRLCMFFVCLC